MTSHWKNDEQLFDLIRHELFTAVVGDVMDHLGFQDQFLPPRITPLRENMVVLGRCMTVLEADVFTERSQSGHAPPLEQPFGLMLRALDDLKPNEVYICTGASPAYALWGELMSVRAMQLHAAGAIVDGYSRDTQGILDLNFPTFSQGRYAQDQAPRGKVIDFRVPLRFGNVHIQSGDIAFGDIDGVCIIPQQAEKDVFSLALEKARGEKRVRKAILQGMSATDAFETFGIM